MDRGIYVALSGAVAQERRMELLADNLANVSTAGFKGQKAVFEEAVPGFGNLLAGTNPRSFTSLDKVVTDMSQGMMENTGRSLDVAIEGDGFFTVKTPNGMRYTRDGSFSLTADGTLVTREGYQVMGEKGPVLLTGPEVSISSTGDIEANGIVVDKLRLVSFNNVMNLVREGNLFAPADDTVKVVPVDPKTTVAQGYVENSNINAVRAMTEMIDAMRSYETHAKMVQTMDEMTRKSIEEVGRT